MAVIVLYFFLMVPWVGLQFVIVALPGHTHLLFDCMSKSQMAIDGQRNDLIRPEFFY